MSSKESVLLAIEQCLLQGGTILDWVNTATKAKLYLFFKILFSEENDALPLMFPESRNLSASDHLFMELQGIPKRSLDLSAEVITKLFLDTIVELEKEQNEILEKRILNISWFATEVEESLISEELIHFYIKSDLSLKNEEYIIDVLTTIDPVETYNLFKASKQLRENPQYYLNYFGILQNRNPDVFFDEFREFDFTKYKDQDELKEMFGIMIETVIENWTHQNTVDVNYVKKKLLKSHGIDDWKSEIIAKVVHENPKFKHLIQVDSNPVHVTKGAEVYDIKYKHFYKRVLKNYIDQNKIQDLEHQSTYDWRIITEAFLNKIISKRSILDIEQGEHMSVLLDKFAKTHLKEFSSFIYETHKLSYDFGVFNFVGTKSRRLPIELIFTEIYSQSVSKKNVNINDVFSGITQRQEE